MTLYTAEQRQANAQRIPQTRQEHEAAARLFPRVARQTLGATTEDLSRWGAEDRIVELDRQAYRTPVKVRTKAEMVALLQRLARRPAPRTDPWAGIDTNPWRITEAERVRFRLGKFR